MVRMPDWATEDGAVQLYCGDCLEILPELGEVDAVVTDPPYGVGFKYESHDDSEKEYDALICSIVSMIGDKLKSGGMAFVWQGMRHVDRFHKYFPAGFRLFASCKNFTQHLPTSVQHGWDPVVFWSNGKTDRRACAGRRDYHIANTAKWVAERSNGHPCPRPVDAVEYVVELSSEIAEVVLDPFMGSGTTAVACIRLGRKFIGIEKEPKYFQIAVDRIEKELERLTLFEPKPEIIKQTSFIE